MTGSSSYSETEIIDLALRRPLIRDSLLTGGRGVYRMMEFGILTFNLIKQTIKKKTSLVVASLSVTDPPSHLDI